MQKIRLLVLFIILQTVALSALAQTNVVQSWRYSTSQERTRVVIDLASEPDYKLMVLEEPHRLVIDINNARFKTPLKLLKPHALISGIRTSVNEQNRLRMTLDLKHAISSHGFSLKPNATYTDHRIVIDLESKKVTTQASKKAVTPTKTKVSKTEAKKSTKKTSKHNNSAVSTLAKAKPAKAKPIKVKSVPKTPRKVLVSKSPVVKTQKTLTKANFGGTFVVAIDAGHGGKDPGAHGPNGTKEKTVVLAIARKVKRLVAKHPDMRPVMVRDGDQFVKLRKRMAIARDAKADLFISIHADAVGNKTVQGASVFTLSRNGASSEAARWLADQENAVDLVGGVSLDDKDDLLASVIMDLSQSATQDASSELAKHTLRNFGNIGRLHKHTVQSAGFVVLKSPDIPSILVETAYISNPAEERKLRSKRYQDKVASAIYSGILAYYQQHMPEKARMAATRHVISSGETLSEIAVQYGVSMQHLQDVNQLSSSQVRVGQVLSIPRS